MRTNIAATIRPGRGSWRSEVLLIVPPDSPSHADNFRGVLGRGEDGGETDSGTGESTAEDM